MALQNFLHLFQVREKEDSISKGWLFYKYLSNLFLPFIFRVQVPHLNLEESPTLPPQFKNILF